MGFSSIKDVISSFKGKRVIIIGDVMIDAYLYGKVNRISPESPVPILEYVKKNETLGGAGNVALNIQALGAQPILYSVIGKDENGSKLIQIMEDKGLSTEGIVQSPNRKTTKKTRLMAESQHLLRVDDEQIASLSPVDQSTLLSKLKDKIKNCDLVIFEDYDKGTIDAHLISEVTKSTKENKVPVVVDPKKNNFLHYFGITLFKPNLKELNEGLGISVVETHKNDAEHLAKRVGDLNDKIHAENYLITLSEQGIFSFHQQKGTLHPPNRKIDISDVCGAGDTVISVAGLACTLNLPLNFIAKLANLAGGLVCEHAGVVPIDINQLIEEGERIFADELKSFQ